MKLLLLLVVAAMLPGCIWKLGAEVVGSGKRVVEARDVGKFSRIDASGATKVFYKRGEGHEVRFEIDDNLAEFVRLKVKGDTLEISVDRPYSSEEGLIVHLSAPTLEGIDLSGASTIDLQTIEADRLEVELSGASEAQASGGKIGTFVADISGASHLDFGDVKTTDAEIDASGASEALVQVSGTLIADASGASSIRYEGKPEKIEADSSGASRIGPGK